MSDPTASYRKVFYDLRPAKQVERRMIIDTLQILSEGGFRIRDYQYTGMGSTYFVDFVLLYRLLGLTRLLSVEYDKRITKRVEFNKPFADIEIKMDTIGTVIQSLDIDTKQILWLDYDSKLQAYMLSDLIAAATRLAVGSILLITVDVNPPNDEGPPSWREYFDEVAGDLVPFGVTNEDFALSELAVTTARILFNAISNGIAGRNSVRFEYLFNFDYSDGHRMLTIGGMLASPREANMVRGCDFSTATYLRRSVDDRPYEIRVPRITRKERLYLDHHMPSASDWSPADFELSDEDVASYRNVYRYYPAYAELLL
jgi:hypothetical protein